MGQLIDPRCFKTRKERYGQEENVIGCAFIITRLRDKLKAKTLSRNNENQIISRLRRQTKMYEDFKEGAPSVTWDNLIQFEQKYQLRIWILSQPEMKSLPKTIRKPQIDDGTDMYLISRKKMTTSYCLR